MDGNWNTSVALESTTQGELTRHRLLRVNLSTSGLLKSGDASSHAASAPNGTLCAVGNGGVIDSGPHFILSPLTPDNRPTLGFEFTLFTDGLGSEAMAFPAGGVTVTIWALVGHLCEAQAGGGGFMWAQFAAINGVQQAQLLHSFDINAGAIRFQISGTADDTLSQSCLIAFSEL